MAESNGFPERDAAIAREARRFVLSGLAFGVGGALAVFAVGWLYPRSLASPTSPLPLFGAFVFGGMLSRYLFHSVVQLGASREQPSTELWETTLEIVRKSGSEGARALWPVLLFSLAIYLLMGGVGGGITRLILITAVLAFHEAGHLTAMQMFGYHDVRIFFVPFLGAMTTGRKASTSLAQQVIVLLAGPTPGLLLGAALLFSPLRHAHAVRQLASLLLVINLFNLMPLSVLDGGRVLNLLLFSRSPRARVGFEGLSAALLALISIELHAWTLVAVSVLAAFSSLSSYRVFKSASALQARAHFPEQLHEASDDFLRQLFEEAYFRVLSAGALRGGPSTLALHCAATMKKIHERGVALAAANL